MEALSDEQLVERYRSQSHSPQGESLVNQLFQRHQVRVAAWCYRMTGDVDRASDLAREIFLKAFQRLDSFGGDSRFIMWLFTLARNHCMDELRSRQSQPEPSGDAVLEVSGDSVRKLAGDTLDETETRVMTLHYVHELPLDSVTRLLGLSNQNGAKAHIVSGKRKLTRAMARRTQRGRP